MKFTSYLFLLSFLLFSCSQKKVEQFKPSILFNISDENCEVSITLPNGSKKLLYNIEEPVFKTGKKCDATDEKRYRPLINNDKDSSYVFINSSFAKVQGGFHIFYIYENRITNIIKVLREKSGISGFEDEEILYRGNLNLEKKETQKPKTIVEEQKLVFERIEDYGQKQFSSNLIFIFKGKNVMLEFYQENSLISSKSGVFRNGKIYLENNYESYEFDSNKVCVDGEGIPEPYCYYFNSKLSTCKIEDVFK